MTFDEAKKKAIALHKEFNMCTEYENGFMFWVDTDEITFGGGDAPKVVLKESGKIISMPEFVMYGMGEEIKDIQL